MAGDCAGLPWLLPFWWLCIMVRFTSHFGEESGTRGELEAKRMALAEKLMVHGALAQRTCMAANFAFWGFSEVGFPLYGVLGSSPQASSPFKWDKGDNAAFQFTRVSKPTQSPRRAATRRSPSQRS